MRKRSQLCVLEELSERTLREDWPVVDGNWRCAGAEEIPCEQVREQCFLGSGVPARQLRPWRKGLGVEREKEQDGVGRPGEQGQCWELTRSESQHQNVRKNAAHKETSRKVSCPRAKFNGRLEPPGWPGKDGTAQTGAGMAFIEGGGLGS
jgi:hypothetical protein